MNTFESSPRDKRWRTVWMILSIIFIVFIILLILLIVSITTARCTLPPEKNTNRTSPIDIDLVVTWVDSDDQERNELRAYHIKEYEKNVGPLRKSGKRTNVYAENSELKYLLKSVDSFAPWIRKIWILCSGNQRPKWLNPNHTRIQVVSDADIMKASHLPTFNSHALECNLYKIPGLSEYFIYSNDDMFFGNVTNPDFFLDMKTKRMKLFPTPLLFMNYGTTYGDCEHTNAWINNHRLLDSVKTEARLYPNHNMTIMSKSAMIDAAQMFSKEWNRTSQNKFRYHTDIHPIGLSQFLSVYRGKSEWVSIVLGYMNMGNSYLWNEAKFNMLALLRANLFCINNSPTDGSKEVMEGFRVFLEDYFQLSKEPKPDWLL
jgi:hypothetical protein